MPQMRRRLAAACISTVRALYRSFSVCFCSDQRLNGCVDEAIGAMPWLAATSMIIRRRRRSSTSASLMFLQTLVPISIWERSSSDVTCAPQRSSHSAMRLSGGSTTRLRVSLSTSKYSSSMPIVNGGMLSAIESMLLLPAHSGGPRLVLQTDAVRDQLENLVQNGRNLIDAAVIVDQVLADFYGCMA